MSLKIGILLLRTTPMSIRIYMEKIRERLPRYNISTVVFDDPGHIPAADLYWDIRTGGGRAPAAELVACQAPLVVTLHDMAHVALPWREFYSSLKDAFFGRLHCRKVSRQWRDSLPRINRIIVPSAATRQDAIRYLPVEEAKIEVIPHGVDHELFNTHNGRMCSAPENPYFLHISQFQKRKNIKRLLKAYQALPGDDKPVLLLKLIGYEGARARRREDGIIFISGVLSHQEIAALYAHAVAFVFPSVKEGFGLPVLEALACGCPVITSKNTACAEVAGEAAFLVNPYSTDEIKHALSRFMKNEKERMAFQKKGPVRARLFNWDQSADLHVKVFHEALK